MTESAIYNLRVTVRKIDLTFILVIIAAFLFDLKIGYSIRGQFVEKSFVWLFYISFFLNGCFSNFKNAALKITEGFLGVFFFILVFAFCQGEVIIASYYEDEKYAVRNGLNGAEFLEKGKFLEKRMGYLEFRNDDNFDIHKGLDPITYYDKKIVKFPNHEAKLIP